MTRINNLVAVDHNQCRRTSRSRGAENASVQLINGSVKSVQLTIDRSQTLYSAVDIRHTSCSVCRCVNHRICYKTSSTYRPTTRRIGLRRTTLHLVASGDVVKRQVLPEPQGSMELLRFPFLTFRQASCAICCGLVVQQIHNKSNKWRLSSRQQYMLRDTDTGLVHRVVCLFLL